MMVNKRLITSINKSKKYIFFGVILNILSLILNIFIVFTMCYMIINTYISQINTQKVASGCLIITIALVLRFFTRKYSILISAKSSTEVRNQLRVKIFDKLVRLGINYNKKISTSEIVQISVEGIEQLEIYFSKYLPQLFYSLLAPVILFILFSFISFKVAIVLLLCVPLIPLSIIAVQKIAKKLLNKYWGIYVNLGDSFLENLEGLTTLKIFKADEAKNVEMNQHAEHFRKITMKVLIMQLNSITIMDLISFGGAAIGMVLSLIEFSRGNIDLLGTMFIILLCSEFFVPLRLLGSFFHIAMNGMAASDKIFNLLDTKVNDKKDININSNNLDINIENLYFSYDRKNQILKDINMNIKDGQFVSIVGESGSGKSTISKLILGYYDDYKGKLLYNNNQVNQILPQSLMESITVVSYNSYVFKGSIRENLLMGNQNATDEILYDTLKKVNLYSFVISKGEGLDFLLEESGNNFSGGQKQRLCLARALLKNSKIYIFDEATSNIDAESEDDIIKAIVNLKGEKTVILISHRLKNVIHSDKIFVLNNGELVEQGNHVELVNKNGQYNRLYSTQIDMENILNIGGEVNEKSRV